VGNDVELTNQTSSREKVGKKDHLYLESQGRVSVTKSGGEVVMLRPGGQPRVQNTGPRQIKKKEEEKW